MCRYACHEYKTHYACFPCRFTAKYEQYCGSATKECPHCRGRMIDLGRDFKAPRRADKNQWRKAELLFGNKIRFRSCGCSGPGYRPRTLADAKADLVVARRPFRPPYVQRPYERFLRELGAR